MQQAFCKERGKGKDDTPSTQKFNNMIGSIQFVSAFSANLVLSVLTNRIANGFFSVVV